MIVCRPGEQCFVKYRFADPGAVACSTDSVGVAITSPRGTRITCKPEKNSTEAAK